MDKNAIKKYAVWARRELLSRVSTKALQYGITEKDCGNPGDDSVNGKLLTAAQKKQRQALIAQIEDKGYQEVMEEVAYTWFNRFSALRFMEVNGYLPTHVRVFTDEDNAFKPQIITEAIRLEIDGLDMEKVYAYKEDDEKDELYKYLLIVQCNALSSILPGMFQRLSDYTELLFPDNLLREGSVIEQMITRIPEEDWKDAVQIIGWLYQYYNAEKKEDVFAALKRNVKITKENIPAATQLFTPDWIVRYMVENSLGRLWLEGHPNAELQGKWNYYLEEAEQEPEVQTQLATIRKEYEAMKPENIKCIEPCCGSGHILAYLFDVLMQIYEAYGYTTREAVSCIVENNLYGLDIDDRAAQLAYFVVMMKARQYDRRFFSRGIQPHVYAIRESDHIDQSAVEYFRNHDSELEKAINCVIRELHDAKEYGSILNITPLDWELLYARFDEVRNDINMSRDVVLNELLPLVQIAEMLAQKYDVVVTNPPYMGASNMNAKLNNFIKTNYSDYKSDFFSAFVVHCSEMTKQNGKLGFITPYVWMFIQSYEKMRTLLCNQKTIESLIQFEYSAFEEATVPVCTFVFSNKHINKKGCYLRLTDFQGGMEVQRIKTLEAIENHACDFYYEQSADNFSKIPGSPIAYWASNAVVQNFRSKKKVETISETRIGMATANNELFMRNWYEVSISRIGLQIESRESAKKSGKIWFPYCKGGSFRKWYGNLDFVVNWYNDGYDIRNFKDVKTGRVRSHNYNLEYIFRPGLTFTAISSSNFTCRTMENALFGSGGSGICNVQNEYRLPLLGLLNSKVAKHLLGCLSLTMNFEVNTVGNLPFICDKSEKKIGVLVSALVEKSKIDWDSFETSWDFVRHPLARLKHATNSGLRIYGTRSSDPLEGKEIFAGTLEQEFMIWQTECDDRFNQLKANEEELNRIFIDIYGLADELTPEVEDKDVTVRKADLQRDIKSLISYAVGCMFGRYSLYNDGLLYAGGGGGDFGSLVEKIQDSLKASGQSMLPENGFYPDKDNIIPICDDEYFVDDIVGRFVKFIEVVYGKDTLDANLKFIADALGQKGQPKDVIRDYFLNGFYADHLKTYQKRPIYWLFDSGKKNGFKAMIYMHRYQPDTIARIRTDYVHEQQGRYRTAIADLENQIENASTSERVKLTRKLTALQAQADEILVYEEKIHHLADRMISIDLDDGVKKNYQIFSDVLAKIK